MKISQITAEELARLPKESYVLVDTRSPVRFEQGHIDGAALYDPTLFLPQGKSIVVCGEQVPERLQREAERVLFLTGGHEGWTEYRTNEENFAASVEEGIRKNFHKALWTPFAKAVSGYRLVQEGDRIAVCISGGKDSMLMAKLFQELKRHRKCNFEVVFMAMDPGYSVENARLTEKNAAALGIPLRVFSSDIFDAVFNIDKNPCYLCARMRRGALYAKARELGCNKIALGHHYDDVIETVLMGMLYGGQIQTMMPKLHSTNFAGMELIRPMYLIREEDIKKWRDRNGLRFLQCACKFTQKTADEEIAANRAIEEGIKAAKPDSSSKRREIKKLIADLKKVNPQVESNIFRSVENVNLATVIAYKDKEGEHHFLDDYDKV